MNKNIFYKLVSLTLFVLVVPVKEVRSQALPIWDYSSGGHIYNTYLGNVGIGIAPSLYRLRVLGSGFFDVGGSGGGVYIGLPATQSGLNFTNTNRADIRFDNLILKLTVGSGTGVPSPIGLNIDTSGKVGIGTTPQIEKLFVLGTIGTTGSAGTVTTQSISTIGWKEKTVTFPFAFVGLVPKIILTQDNSGTGDMSLISFRVKKNTATTSGFTIEFYVDTVLTAGTTKFKWMALQ